MREFRLNAVVVLPDDEFEAASAMVRCGEWKEAVRKLAADHKLSATISHETVTPRTSKSIPSAPAVTMHPVAALLSGISDDQKNTLNDSLRSAAITAGTIAPLRGRTAAE